MPTSLRSIALPFALTWGIVGGYLLFPRGVPAQSSTPAPAVPAPAAPVPANPKVPLVKAPPIVPFIEFTLGNGLKVLVQEDHRTPFVTVYVSYHVGALDEAKGRSGLAHFFEHLMFEGSKGTWPGNTHSELTRIGASNRNAETGWEVTTYHETVPAQNLANALWLESDRMRYLTAADNSDRINEVRDVVKNERRERLETVPYGLANEVLWRALFPPSHPYFRTVVGSMEDLDEAQSADMRAFYDAWYGPNNATLVLVGDLQPARAQALVQEHFGSLSRCQLPKRAHLTVPPLTTELKAQLQDPIASQPALLLGWLSPAIYSDEDAVADLLAHILSQRMTRRLRNQIPVAVSAHASQVSQAMQSVFQVMVLLRGANGHGKAQTLVDALLSELQQGTVDETELEQAKLWFKTDLYSDLENPVRRASLLSEYARYFPGADGVRANLSRYERVTGADLQRFASRYLRRDSRVRMEVNASEDKRGGAKP